MEQFPILLRRWLYKMHRKREDFVVTVLKHSVVLIVGMIVVGIIMTLVNLFYQPKLILSGPFATTAQASIFYHPHKKERVHRLKITTKPQIVRVVQVNDDNSLVIKGSHTYRKRVHLFLVTFPPKGCYYAVDAHKALKKAVANKKLLVLTDKQADNSNQVYLETQKQLIQGLLLRKGCVSLHNYNGSEKYFSYMLALQNKAKDESKGIWYIPGYVTDIGYNKKAGKLNDKQK